MCDTAVPSLKRRLAGTTTPIPALTSSALWLAKDLGFYQREGLDVDIAITVLQAGGLDVATLTLRGKSFAVSRIGVAGNSTPRRM